MRTHIYDLSYLSMKIALFLFQRCFHLELFLNRIPSPMLNPPRVMIH